jgi:hypothetical protein
MQEAILAAARADAHEGLARTNEDKRKAVETLLATAWGKNNSDAVVAEAAGVSQPFVSKLRRSTQNRFELQRKRTGKDGKTRSIKQRKRASRTTPASPDQPSEDENAASPIPNPDGAQDEPEWPKPASAGVSTDAMPSPPGATSTTNTFNTDDSNEQGESIDGECACPAGVDDGPETAAVSTKDAPPAASTETSGTGTERRVLDTADFLNASSEERTAYVQLLGLGVFIDALPEIKIDEPKPLNDEHFQRMCRLIVGALRYVEANDQDNAVDALRGALRVLGSQGRNVDDLAFALRATLKIKKASRSISSTFKNARSAKGA